LARLMEDAIPGLKLDGGGNVRLDVETNGAVEGTFPSTRWSGRGPGDTGRERRIEAVDVGADSGVVNDVVVMVRVMTCRRLTRTNHDGHTPSLKT